MYRLLCPLLLLVWGCSSVRTDESAGEPELVDTLTYESFPDGLVPSANKAEMIMLPDADAATVRGSYIGATRRQVVSAEASQPLEEEADQLLLTVDLDSTEFADITYHFDSSERLRAYNIEVYLRNEASLMQTHREFVRFFTDRYGPARSAAGDPVLVWATPEFHQVRMSTINQGLDRGIDIEIK